MIENGTETLICDWGSSNLRSFLVAPDGTVQKRYESDQGIKAITGGEAAYRETLDAVLEQVGASSETPIRISGVAGSKNGWIETDYLPTPAGREEISSNFIPLPGYSDARLCGGLVHKNASGARDVMRGEEIQVLGVLATHPDAHKICLPGTHSKWVTVEEGRITDFRTSMTGDLFHSLLEHSIFKEQVSNWEFHRDGFLHGCRLANEGNNLDDLFRLRTEFVFGNTDEDSFRSCLSGFLIANEIRAANTEGMTCLCGSETLTTTYALALEEASIQSSSINSESATIRGHLSLSQP